MPLPQRAQTKQHCVPSTRHMVSKRPSPAELPFPKRPGSTLPAPVPSPSAAAGALHVLVVEDDQSVREVCASLAASSGCRVRTADTLAGARQHLLSHTPDVVLLDLHLPDGSGAALLGELHKEHPRALVTVISAHLTVNRAMDLMRGGAVHVLEKPFALRDIDAALQSAFARRHTSESSRALHERLEAGLAPGGLVARSPAMRKVLSMVSKVASTRHPLLITGERGTGKERVARTVHANGPHALSPFVPVDCDSLEPSRLEVELFGDETGTDPHRGIGLLATADDGTVCLHEIGALALGLQARLLRLLETRQLRRKDGSEAGPPFRARLIAASSQDLEELVAHGQFRRDLFYKLNVTQLRIPPLRERAEDLMPLAEQFLEAHRAERGIPFVLSEQGVQAMARFDWPGNVAELEALIAHACLLSIEPVLHFEDMPTQVRSYTDAVTPAAAPPGAAGESFLTLEEREKEAIGMALAHTHGDKIAAARMLGIGKTTLYRKLKEYGIADDAQPHL